MPTSPEVESTFFGLTGKKALIIGGGQGMGESSAVLLARAGCDLALVDLIPDRADAVGRRAIAFGRRSFTIAGNVLDDDQIHPIIAEAEAKLGGLDLMVSIVGGAVWGSLLETTGDIWDEQMRLNLRYFFLVAKQVAQSLIRRDQPGAIVGIASVDGQRAAPMRGVYGAAKAGLISLVQTMAVEWAPHSIRVNAIAPGHIVTPRLYDTPQRIEAYSTSLLPMRRRGTPDDIASAALFLSSDMARYITGTTLDVDGGQLAANMFPLGLPGINTPGR